MIRNLLNAYIDLIYATIQYPQDLPALVAHMNTRPYLLFLSPLLPAISSATGIYYMRSFYNAYYPGEVFFLFLVHFLFILITGLLLGSVMNSLVLFLKPGRESRAWSSISLSILSSNPLIFIMPAAMISKMFEGGFVFFLVFLILLAVWSISVFIRSTRYLFELTYADTAKSVLGSLLLVFLFPVLLFVFVSVEAMELLY